jgi:hypothetical protein
MGDYCVSAPGSQNRTEPAAASLLVRRVAGINSGSWNGKVLSGVAGAVFKCIWSKKLRFASA